MTILLEINPFLGAFIASLIFILGTGILALTVHLFFRRRRPKEFTPFVNQICLRIGTIHALLVAFVFGVLTTELFKLQNASDSEAISAANIYFTLIDNPSEEAVKLRNLIPIYLQTVIKKDWIELSKTPNDLPAWNIITQMQKITLSWNTVTVSEEMLRRYVFENLNTIAESRNIRIIERQAPNLPLIFWVIAIMGYILTILPLFSIELDKRRFLLICCYAIIIGTIFYGIVLLDKPFLSRAVKPNSFEVMYNDVTSMALSSSLRTRHEGSSLDKQR